MESILLALISVEKRECVRVAERRERATEKVVPYLCSSERERGDTENSASVASTVEYVKFSDCQISA